MMPKFISTLFFSCIICLAFSQIDSTLLKNTPKDSSSIELNMDAIYNRPFLNLGHFPISLGGYVEANWQHIGTDGVSDGHQFQFRRMTLFVASTVLKRIQFLSEIEFEPAEKEIAIEFAAVDVEIHPLLNLRGGMILNPIGAFNQNHDGPKWEFTDRPIAMSQMLPATWSNVGFGLYGKYHIKKWMLAYEFYMSSGFDNSIVSNEQNKTYLPASKKNTERFEELASGVPLLTAKIALDYQTIGEFGFSYMGGIYNQWKLDGLVIDDKRNLNVFAIDFNSELKKLKTKFLLEWAWVNVQLPSTYTEQYGNQQYGGFMDVVQPIIQRKIGNWKDASLNLAFRIEYVDWNVGEFMSTNTNRGDELISIMPGISFRPSSKTVLRLNYRYQWHVDVLNNPPSKTAGFSLGLSSYF